MHHVKIQCKTEGVTHLSCNASSDLMYSRMTSWDG